MQDYYEILQVHPRADQETIRAAYERLRERYDASRIEGAADELVELARQRRDEIERAYAILGDNRRRTSYDEELRTQAEIRSTPAVSRGVDGVQRNDEEAELDYSPLPPAHRQERPRGFDAQPVRAARPVERRSGRQVRQPLPVWAFPAMLVGGLTFVVVLATLLIAGGPQPQQAAQAPAGEPTPTEEQIVNQFEGQIVEARQVTRNAPDNVNAWVNLGNVLYDSAQVVRERMPDSDLYKERLSRWIEASEAYSQALKLQPANAVVRADLAASLCYYGAGTGDQGYVSQGVNEARTAFSALPDEGRVLLNLGICLISAEPPVKEEAIEYWRKAVTVADPQSGVAFEAQRLITLYSTP